MKGEGGGGGEGEGGLVCTSITLTALETRFAVQAKSIPHAASTTLPPYSLLFTPYSLPQNSHCPDFLLTPVIAFAEPYLVSKNALVHGLAAVGAVPLEIGAGAVEYFAAPTIEDVD